MLLPGDAQGTSPRVLPASALPPACKRASETTTARGFN